MLAFLSLRGMHRHDSMLVQHVSRRTRGRREGLMLLNMSLTNTGNHTRVHEPSDVMEGLEDMEESEDISRDSVMVDKKADVTRQSMIMI